MWSLIVLSAIAADDLCADGACDALERALTAGLAADGFGSLASVEVEVDTAGSAWVTVASKDKSLLDGLARDSGARTVLVGRLYERTVPVWLLDGPGGEPLEAADYLLHIDGIDGGDGDGGGGGGGGGSCEEVCVCTESGPECWQEC